MCCSPFLTPSENLYPLPFPYGAILQIKNICMLPHPVHLMNLFPIKN